MPKISVIMPAYNHEKFVGEAIESVLNQTFGDFEFIIGDDGSTDRTWDVISKYSDPRINAIRGAENKRDFIYQGVKTHSSADLVAIHHSDDVWEPTKLEKQVRHLDENPECAAVFTYATAIDESGDSRSLADHHYDSVFFQRNRSRWEWLNHFFYKENALCHPSVMIRKKHYEDCGPYPYGFLQLTDLAQWIRVCLRYDIYVIPEKLVRFRVLDKERNTSGNRPDVRVRHSIEVFQLYREFLKLNSFEEISAVFPSAKKYYRAEGMDKRFLLAMMALENPSTPGMALFGMSLLFEVISDPASAQRVKDLYGFTSPDLMAITSKYDVFSVQPFREQLKHRIKGVIARSVFRSPI